MNFRLPNPRSRWAVLALVLAVCFLMIYSSARIWWADREFASNTQAGRLRAVQIEPGNGDDWYRLALNTLLDLENPDPQRAIDDFRHAVNIDPCSDAYWMALGEAYEQTGEIEHARQAFETAVSDYPSSAEVHWRYGSFLLRQAQLPQAYAEIHRALAANPALTTLAISRVWRASHDPQVLLAQVLPNNDGVLRDALAWLVNAHEPQAALQVWDRLAAAGKPMSLKIASPLVDLLIASQQGDDARTVWARALALSGNAADEPGPHSLVFNGGFERDSANDGLDWHLDAAPGVTYAYDTARPHSGRQALSVAFDGSQNMSYRGVWQFVPVRPSTSYHFSAALRTAGITTDKGLGIVISFPGSGQPPVYLEPLTGDHEWLTQQADFTTAPGTRIAQIWLSRDPSQKFDNKLAGTIWLDDISLVPAGSASSRP
jgi:tetratricopeptide (TPR) repeat protein